MSSVIKKQEKIKQKRGGSGVGDTIKWSWEVWLKIESKHEPLWWGKKYEWKLMYYSALNAKAFWCNRYEANKGNYDTRRGLRSSSLTRVVTIQTIDTSSELSMVL